MSRGVWVGSFIAVVLLFSGTEPVDAFDVIEVYTGIGLRLRKDEATHPVSVVTPVFNGPAYKVGIRPGDLIETITRETDSNGKALPEAEVSATRALTLSEVSRKLMGVRGTKVKLTIRRGHKVVEYVVECGPVRDETVFGFRRNADDSWDHMIDPDKKIGYVRLLSFGPNTAQELREVVANLRNQGMKSLVLDLRFNPGGLLNAAIQVADLFVNDETIVRVKSRAGPERRIAGEADGSLTDFPITCLINGSNGGASEIVAACLQDNKRASVGGARSRGKASFQSILDFDGGSLKLTTSTFWTPTGKNLNKPTTAGRDEDEWGVRPDKELELLLPAGEEDVLADAFLAQEIVGRGDKQGAIKTLKDRQLELVLNHLRTR